ncbi:MAG: hypothetical protein U1E47_09560 [Rivihabitans pingtungensis]
MPFSGKPPRRAWLRWSAAQSGAVSAERLAFLQKLTDELSPRS